ncbi:MAG: FkbM family methyltransferase [Hominimerdicola sp.]
MLDIKFFKDLESSWERMKNSSKPVYIYGMGDGCEKILAIMRKKGIEPKGIFASDDFSRGQTFCGYKVKNLSQVEREEEDFLAVLAFGTSLPEIMERIEGISQRYEVIAPDCAVIGDEYFDKEHFLDNFHHAEKAYSLLCDEQSRLVFENLTAFKITGKIEYLKKIFTNTDESHNLLDLSEAEIYCDLGAYNGDTICEFLSHTNGKYEKIYAFEPNRRNFQKCMKNTKNLDNIEYHNSASWERDTCIGFTSGSGRQAQADIKGRLIQARALDSVLGEKKCTYIKYDVEGADFQALKGSVKTIRKYSPKICMALYHRPYDYIDIPLYIYNINADYNFYMRQFPYYPAWETNLFCKI